MFTARGREIKYYNIVRTTNTPRRQATPTRKNREGSPNDVKVKTLKCGPFMHFPILVMHAIQFHYTTKLTDNLMRFKKTQSFSSFRHTLVHASSDWLVSS